MPDIKRLSEEIGQNKISAVKRVIYRDFPIHWHEYYEIEYIVSGHGTYVINNVEYSISPGSLFFVTPIDFASLVYAGEPITLINISFSESWISDRIVNSITSHGFIADYPEMLCAKILEELSSSQKYSSNYIRFALGCILIDVIRSVKSNNIGAKASKNDMVVSDMLTYIHAHFREDLTLLTLSEHIGLTPNYLSKIFNSYMGTTFKSYVVDLKLKYATALLTQTNTSVTDICYLCGFNSFSHFLRTFKNKYNVSPLIYRKEHSKEFVF